MFRKKKKLRANPLYRKIPKTVQESIPYKYIYDNGVIETDDGIFTKTYRMEDVNFKIAPEDDQKSIFLQYEKVLNSFSPGTKFQVLIHNHQTNKKRTMQDIRFPAKNDGLNKYRAEMNEILLKKMSQGKSSISQAKYFTVSIEEDDVKHAMERLNTLDGEINRMFRRVAKDSAATPLSIEERIELLSDIYNQDGEGILANSQDKEGNPVFSISQYEKLGMKTKDIIGPSGMEFMPGHFKLGNTYGQSFYLHSISTFLSTEFISDLSDISANLLISVTYEPLDMAKATRQVKDRLTAVQSQIAKSQKNAARNGYSSELVSPKLKRQEDRADDLLKDILSRDQKLFYVTVTMTLFGDTKEALTDSVQQVYSISNKYSAPLKTVTGLQNAAFNSTLPLCLTPLATHRLMTTEAGTIFIPYTTQEMHQKGGTFYGLNETSNNMILFNRRLAENGNGLIFGRSGTGKSMTAKQEILANYLKDENCCIYIIDPDEEYTEMVSALKGEVINLAPGSQTYINPLDMSLDYSDGTNPLSFKADYVISMMEIMHGTNGKISPEEKSVLSRCVQNIYRGYISYLDEKKNAGYKISENKELSPTLNSLYEELLRQNEPEATSLAKVLEIYANGTLATFAHKTNVDTKNRLIDYNIKKLGTGMKELGLHVCLNDIWNRLIENQRKGIATYFYIDEMYLLLRMDAAASFLMEIWKRARKMNGFPTGIMQNSDDIMRNAETRALLNNTSFIILHSLARMDQLNFAELLSISDSQLTYIDNNSPGHGLIYTGKSILPFANEFPEETELYKLISTSKSKDELRRRLEQYA